MQRKASKYGRIRPSRLLASSSKQAKILNSLTSDYQQDSDSKNKANAARSKELGERYSNEVASVSRMKEYELLATRQREVLFNENKNLREKFSEDVQEAISLEKNISKISSMISEFLQILQTQSETVQDVHSAGRDANNQVEQTEEELALTIKRTESYTNTIFLMLAVFTVLLLLLDYLSP